MPDVKVGLAVVVVNKKNEFLVGERKGSFASGTVAFPGGKLEINETLIDGSLRELGEECGTDLLVNFIKFNKFDYLFVTNNVMERDKIHFVTFFLVAKYISGDVKLMEPDKCKGWKWMSFEEIKNHASEDWIPINLIKNFDYELACEGIFI